MATYAVVVDGHTAAESTYVLSRHATAVEAHLRWWRVVWESQKRRGFETVTMTPEFGPDGYLQCEPFTQKPVADLWELNVWTANRLRQEFAQWEQAQEINA